MGPCKICNEPGCFGFSEPGPRSERREGWRAWACILHREEVEARWRAHTRPDSPRPAPAQPQQGGGEAVSADARGTKQGILL